MREIDISKQARALRFLRFTDHTLVIICGFWLARILSKIVQNQPVLDNEALFFLCVYVVVLSNGIYIGYRHTGVIDANVWQAHILFLPILMLLSLFSVWMLLYFNPKNDSADPFYIIYILFGHFWIAATCLTGFISAWLLRRMRITAIGISLVELSSYFRSQRELQLQRAARVQRVNTPRGIVIGGVGIIIILVIVLISNELNSAFGPYLSFLGWFLLLRARRYFQVSADALLAVDNRSPILFLRPFSDDKPTDQTLFDSLDNSFIDYSLEARLSNHFTHFGPFIAIGSPKDTVPQLGAARLLLSDDEWQQRVMKWISEASLIIMYPGKSYWVNWELAKIIEAEQVKNLILIMPEIQGWSDTGRAQNIATRLEPVMDIFKNTKWGTSLAAIKDYQDVRAMSFGNDESMIVIRSKPDNRDSNHLAALIAHYLILNKIAAPVIADGG
jgi:hypothetical protein